MRSVAVLTTLAGLASARTFALVKDFNSVPADKKTTQKSLNACEATCTGTCTQFTFNSGSNHCHTSSSTVFTGVSSDHCESGCDPAKVANCTQAAPTPPPPPTPPTPPPPTPATPFPFDGKRRACPTDPGRVDAYMIPPQCPAVTDCKVSSNHCNFLEAIPAKFGGGLALAWFSGYREGWDLTRVVSARLPAGSNQWSSAVQISQQVGFSAQNPLLYADEDSGTLYAWHTRQPKGNKGASAGWGGDPVPSQEVNGKLWISRSKDWGGTWDEVGHWH